MARRPLARLRALAGVDPPWLESRGVEPRGSDHTQVGGLHFAVAGETAGVGGLAARAAAPARGDPSVAFSAASLFAHEANAAEQREGRARAASWKDWAARTACLDGARGAHRWSKPRVGWAPSTDSSGKVISPAARAGNITQQWLDIWPLRRSELEAADDLYLLDEGIDL